MINYSQVELESICNIVADTNNGLTKTELEHKLKVHKFEVLNKNVNGYSQGLKKSKWLFNCLANEINRNHNYEKIHEFIGDIFNPINYTNDTTREKYYWMKEEINKILLLIGYEIKGDGVMYPVCKAETLTEVDRRVNSLKQKLYYRAIHSEVSKYCIKDYLEKDFFDAVFEASKGLAERIREITGLAMDGRQLFDTAFSTKSPYLVFNSLKTESEKSEFIGLKELVQAIFHIARNPEAHTPKINWKVDEAKALDVLTLISFAHKYLDECIKVPKK